MHQYNGGIGKTAKHHVDLVGSPEIILVGEGYEGSSCPAQALFEIAVQSQPDRMDMELDSGIFLPVGFHNVGGSVCRGIIADDQFQPAVGLAEDAFDLRTDKGFALAGGQYDRNKCIRTGRCHV